MDKINDNRFSFWGLLTELQQLWYLCMTAREFHGLTEVYIHVLNSSLFILSMHSALYQYIIIEHSSC